MTWSVFVLVVFSALGWSLFDVARKSLSTRISVLKALFLFMLCALPIFGSWSLFFGDRFFVWSYFPFGFVALVVNFLANICFISSVQRAPLSETVPLLAFVPALTATVSFLILGEELQLRQIWGIAAIVLGALILNGLPSLKGEKRGALLMFCAALAWALMGVFDKICLDKASIPIHSLIQHFGIGVITGILLLWRKERFVVEDLKCSWKILVLGSLASAAAISFQLMAIQQVPVGLMESGKRSLSMIFSLIFGALVFSESLTLKKWAAVILMTFGTYLVAS